MTTPDPLEQRLIDLEIRFSYADDLLEVLNAQVARQQDQIDRLMAERAAAVDELDAGVDDPDEPEEPELPLSPPELPELPELPPSSPPPSLPRPRRPPPSSPRSPLLRAPRPPSRPRYSSSTSHRPSSLRRTFTCNGRPT